MTKIIFIDAEISGMRAFDEIIDFAAIQQDVTDGVSRPPEVVFNSLIRGASDIDVVHSKLTGITLADLTESNSKTIDDVVNFLTFNENSIFASYNLQFDVDWIQHTALMNNLDVQIKLRGICLMNAVTKMLGYQCGLDKFMNINRHAHRALPDAQLHRLVLQRLSKCHLTIEEFYGGTPLPLT